MANYDVYNTCTRITNEPAYTSSSGNVGLYIPQDAIGSTQMLHNSRGSTAATTTASIYTHQATKREVVAVTLNSGGQANTTWNIQILRPSVGDTTWRTINTESSNSIINRILVLEPGDSIRSIAGSSSSIAKGYGSYVAMTPTDLD